MIYGYEHGASRRYPDAIEKIFGIESAQAALPPGIIVEADRPEWAFLKRECLWFGRISLAASIGNFSTIRFGSVQQKFLSAVSLVYIESGAAPLNVGFVRGVAGGFAAGGSVEVRDSRWKQIPSSGIFTRQTTQVLSAPDFVINPGIPLALHLIAIPGTQGLYYFETQAVNTALALNLLGYERPVTEDELAF